MSRDEGFGSIPDGVVAIRGDTIEWVGPADDAPRELLADPARTLDAAGGWVTPGLIDPHTHLVFGGDRTREFEMRLGGATYEEIARAGGGILSTVQATRAASEEQLYGSAESRLHSMLSMGVTTVEIKSGYGLDVETELRMLRVARRLGERNPVTVTSTLLAAHALPPEYAGDRAGYVRLVTDEMLPEVSAEGLADAVDAFCESIAFGREECARVFEAGAALGLAVRIHADQLSDSGGASLAAACGARSADHLEYASAEGIHAMAAAGTTAVLLPGAFYFLREKRAPPVEAMRAAGVKIALGTDLNPGSSPMLSPLLALNMGCVLFGLTPAEALAGMTSNAAPVLGMEDRRGRIAPGLAADLAVWDVSHPAELSYWMGANPCRAVVKAGRIVTSR